MSANSFQVEAQLRDACQISAARWAAWLERGDMEWLVIENHALSKTRQKALNEYIKNPTVAAWLSGTLGSGRTRWRATGSAANRLGCLRLHAFPSSETHHVLLAGSDGLDKASEGIFRILARYSPPDNPVGDSINEVSLMAPASWPFDANLEASYEPQRVLESVLEFLATKLPCDASYMAIRTGDIFHVQATWKTDSNAQGFEIRIQDDQPLSTIVASHQGLILDDISHVKQFALRKIMAKTTHSWMGIPILIGQRVIGLVAFASALKNQFTNNQLQQGFIRVNRLAYHVESAIIFNEVTRYLQQLALLNELASSASMGIETDKAPTADEFARRVMQRLRRVFSIDWAAVLLYSQDGKQLHEFGGGSLTGPPWIVPVEQSLMGQAAESGMPLRVGDVRNAQRYFPIRSNISSELVAPLKYRGRVIGVIVLVSEEPNAFTLQDEQLLVVIASHMAGLFENVRLHEETRERAKKLADSVRQLQAVRDTSLDIAGDLDFDALLLRLTLRAKSLLDARGAELGLYREDEQVVEIVVSETPWENVQGIKIPLMAGVAGRLAAFGEPLVVNDYNSWQGRLLPERKAHFQAVAGVPLKFRGEVIGTLTVLDDRPDKEFQSEDVQLLELLAPQAAISIRNARLYQELQERITAQQLAESRLVRSARLAAVGEMAAGIAHELNNPLTTVIGFVELVLNELPEESSERADLALVLEEANRARGVVRRLLDFSRPAEDQRLRADVNEIINQILPLVNHLARTSKVEILTDLDSALPWITIDSNQIKQVLLNLVHNALQAMPDGGTLSVKTSIISKATSSKGKETTEYRELRPDWISIAISDTGEGIPPVNLERLFEPFFTTRPSGKGTGLGLSVSYGIIASHGGTIEVESQPHEGSCFSVLLPVDRDLNEERPNINLFRGINPANLGKPLED